MNLAHDDEQVNGHNTSVDETPQNMETDEDVDGINWSFLPNKIWRRISRTVLQLCDFTGDKHGCLTFIKLCKVRKRFNDMAWNCVDQLPRLYFNKELISKPKKEHYYQCYEFNKKIWFIQWHCTQNKTYSQLLTLEFCLAYCYFLTIFVVHYCRY